MFDVEIENVEIENGKIVITLSVLDIAPQDSQLSAGDNKGRWAYWYALGKKYLYWAVVVGLVWVLIK